MELEFWRIILIPLMLSLSILDLCLTQIYISSYKKRQPKKPLGLIEMNPLLVLLMTHLGINAGMVIGGFIILGLVLLITSSAHLYVVIVILLLLLFAIFNHFKNIRLLHKLIEKYPEGHLPEKVFGQVEGNNE
jgi:hypothetical protein